MEPLSFRVPEQVEPADDSFATDAAAVGRWVSELPMGNIGEAAKQIYAALQETNGLRLPMAERMELLEQLAIPLAEVMEALRRHFDNCHFPMPAKALRVADFSNQLLRQVVIGYHAVLDGGEASSWLFRMTHHKLWRVSVHRVLHYLGQLLCNFRLLHRSPPAGVWVAVHRLYAEAREHSQHRKSIALSWNDGVSETVEDAYKRLLLMSLLEPQRFKRPQFKSVVALQSLWLGQVHLAPTKRWYDGMQAYCIRLDQDTPHTVYADQCLEKSDQGSTLLFDVTELSQLLEQALDSGEGEHISLSGGGVELERDTVEILRQSWQVHSGERKARHSSQLRVQTAIGLSAIFSLMREQRRRHHTGITDQEYSDDLKPLLAHGEVPASEPPPSIGDPQGGVWDTIFYGTNVMTNSWALGGDEKHYQFTPAEQRDYNEHGYCLAYRHDQLKSLDVGELIGLMDEQSGVLQLCTVRWLEERDDELLVGVMRLADELEPVLVVMSQDGRGDTALGSLLGIGADNRPQLFLPHLPGLTKRKLQLIVDKRQIPISLKDKVALSALYLAYHFNARDEWVETPLDAEMGLQQANNLLQQIAHSDEDPVASGDRDEFDDLWRTL